MLLRPANVAYRRKGLVPLLRALWRVQGQNRFLRSPLPRRFRTTVMGQTPSRSAPTSNTWTIPEGSQFSSKCIPRLHLDDCSFGCRCISQSPLCLPTLSVTAITRPPFGSSMLWLEPELPALSGISEAPYVALSLQMDTELSPDLSSDSVRLAASHGHANGWRMR